MDKRQQARELWEASAGQRTLKDIAAELGVPEGTLRTWKRRDGWGETAETQRAFRKDETQRETNRKRQASINRAIADQVDDNRELTEVEKDFCLYYVQSYNATTAAWKTGAYSNLNSAKQNGWRMKHDPACAAEIKRLKDIKRGGILADVDDLIELHMRIAFASMDDFALWVYDPATRSNRMAVLQSDAVDAQLVREVSETRDGFKIKLRDPDASMAFLERFFEANPMDKHKKAYDNARLELERQKLANDARAAMLPAIEYNIKEHIAPAFHELHDEVQDHKHTYWWLKGGRGSTKSSFISLEIVDGIMQHPGTHAIVFRAVYNTIQDSVYEQLLWAIDALGVADYWRAQKSPLKLIYRPTGQQIIFRGMDDPLKTKSIKAPAGGYYRYLWFEELDQFDSMEEIRTAQISAMRGGDEFDVFYSYNPPESINNWVNVEAKIPLEGRRVHHSTYLDVPREWLPEEFLAAAEHLKEVNETKYRHVYLGEETGTGGEVFNNLTSRRITDEEIAAFDQIKQGLDWGYGADPFAWTKMHFDKTRLKLYIFDEIYALRLKNRDAAEQVKARAAARVDTICDSAEPKSIDEFRDLGVRVRGAIKGPDSVEYGIKFLQDLEEIIIDPKRCPNTWAEFSAYELEKNAHGLYKSGYPDKNNHTVDCARYALEDDMRRSGGRFVNVRM